MEGFGQRAISTVMADNKWGAINRKGKTIVPLQYAYTFLTGSGNVITCNNDGLYGVYDSIGVEIIRPTYDYIEEFYNQNVMCAVKGPYWGVIDRSNKEVLPFTYDLTVILNGYIFSFKNSKQVKYDFTGKLQENDYDSFTRNPDGRVIVYILDNGKKKYGLLRKDNSVLLATEYSAISYYSSTGLYRIVKNGNEGIYNASLQKWIIPLGSYYDIASGAKDIVVATAEEGPYRFYKLMALF